MTEQYESVWDALEEDPIKAQNYKLRSDLMMAVTAQIKQKKLTQADAAELLAVSQPRISSLLNGKLDQFRIDMLIDFAHKLGLHVSVDVAA
ncbi:XRE family transcriptional regulator [Endozoicomonas sp. SM1973]|uniref:XRE family transcriptional regulator n=1 Tax=Spartinivicinus marinus TaxID=2994442 RepID=A0A853IFM1_9GAMM|nr:MULTISPECIES: XRE family transcriptional regulator [Spartinivicinus]NYZ69338.1 XRE family transcriptional regulator [Spartinivicinus marinus]